MNCGDRTDAVIEANRRAWRRGDVANVAAMSGRAKTDSQAVPEAVCPGTATAAAPVGGLGYEHTTQADEGGGRAGPADERLWQSKALADGLLAGRPVVPARGFAVWLQQYPGVLNESP